MRTLLMTIVLAWTMFSGTPLLAGEQNSAGVPLEQEPADPAAAKIVILAGGNLVPTKPSGDHEYFAGSVVLSKLLAQTPGVHPVIVTEGWPRDTKVFQNARAVVFYMDGLGKAPHTLEAQRMDVVQKLVDQGVGMVHLHQVIDYPAESAGRAMSWLGGVSVVGKGTRGHWDQTISGLPEHPVTRGVGPFTVNDGFILKLQWVEGMRGVTPLMRAWNPKTKDQPGPTDDIVAWTYQRTGGGRSFAFTGMHGHSEWGIQNLRRFVVNGVLWAAKLEVPAGGAPVAIDPAELSRHMDVRTRPAPKAASKPRKAG